MRVEFVNQMMELASDPEFVFLTGDLGFNAFECLQKKMGKRFINCGVSEQNMIGVAAGLAKNKKKVVAYSIAPFIYARPFEQIRNDIIFGKVNVKLIGNGGGYGYGYMGPTHHALEDCAVMSSLGLSVEIPSFDNDLKSLFQSFDKPTYIRLGVDESNYRQPPSFKPLRKLLKGKQQTMIVLGPLSGNFMKLLKTVNESSRPNLWSASSLSFESLPSSLKKDITDSSEVIIVEEHVKRGGLGEKLVYQIFKEKLYKKFTHFFSTGYEFDAFGSQTFHRELSNLDFNQINEIYKWKN